MFFCFCEDHSAVKEAASVFLQCLFAPYMSNPHIYRCVVYLHRINVRTRFVLALYSCSSCWSVIPHVRLSSINGAK